jgi:hypothetical protein
MRLVANGEETLKVSGDSPNTIYLVSQKRTRVKKRVEHLTRAENVEIGQKNEQAISHVLEHYFKMDLYKDEEMYAKCDFYNNEYKEDATVGVEVKGRVDIKHDLYRTAFVDVHKVEAHLAGKEYNYVFIYGDGIYYIKYNKAQFDKYNINTTQTEWRDDVKRYENSPKYDVPYTDMTLVCLFNNK